MGNTISSAAEAAAESLADDLQHVSVADETVENDNTTTSSIAAADDVDTSNNVEASSSATATSAINASTPVRRTKRKSHQTDFYAPYVIMQDESDEDGGQSKEEFIRKLNDKWMERRERLITYKAEHGTFFVSPKVDAQLAKWVENQKQFHRTGKMSHRRFQLLQDIGFFDEKAPLRSPKSEKENTTPLLSTPSGITDGDNSSTKKSLEEQWKENLQALIAYKNEHGTFFVAPTANTKLARWAENQRQCQRRGGMSARRYQQLQQIGFFDEQAKNSPRKKATSTINEAWEENRQALIDHKNENGGSISFHSKSKLGRWVENQKRAHKLGKMSEKRIALLNEIDFFNADQQRRDEAIRKSANAAWEKNRQELIAYKEVNGDFAVAAKSKLGRWIENQRRVYKLKEMSAERAELLKEIGMLPENPEDMVDGRTTPRKRKAWSSLEEEEGVSPVRKLEGIIPAEI